MKKKICILTSTRAEYGLLKPLISKLINRSEFDVRIAVTGMHLAPEFGFTYLDIEKDGFKIDKKVEMLINSNTHVGVSKSMGLTTIGFAEYFDELKPDLLIVLGDRFETLAVCIAAMNARIPIAHLHGGESTEGVIDEAIRHSISKMSYLHFTSTEEYRKRVIQLGEDPERVFNVGAIGLEVIKEMNYLNKEQLEESIGFRIDKKLALLTFHPVTLEDNTAEQQFQNLLDAIDAFDDLQVIITKANADMGGRSINHLIDVYERKRTDKCKAFQSLGQQRYLSTMKICDFVIGNSSSGIIEAPSFETPTINIGDRQMGRVQANSVISCEPTKEDIISAIEKALSKDFRSSLIGMINPYGDGNVSDKIIIEIEKFLCSNNSNKFLKKQFYNINF